MLQFPPVTMRKTTLISVVAACVLLGAAACAGGTASKGEARVVVMPISGSSAADGAITEVVESRYELVSARRYAKTARKLRAKSKDDEDIRKVSRKLNIDALVHGEFVKRGKRKYVLRLSLRAGASGAEFESVTVKLRSKKLSKRDRSKIQKKLYAALSEVDSWSQDDSSDDTRSSRGRRSADSDDKERERARRLRKKQQEKDMREDEKRLARSERDRKNRSDDEAESFDDDEDDRDRDDDDRDDDRNDDDDDDRDRKSRSSKSAKAESKKPESKKSKKLESSKTAKTASKGKDKDDERSSSTESKKKKTKKDESYKVITVRDDDGQALDNESPF